MINDRKMSKFVRVIISVILLVILFKLIDWSIFLEQIARVSLLQAIITIPLFFLGVFFSVLRWRLILDFLGIHISKKVAFRLYLEGSFLNNFIPTSVGGDIYKYFILSRLQPLKKKEAFVSLFFERGAGLLTFFVLNLLLSIFFYRLIFEHKALFLFEVLIFIVFLAFLFFLFSIHNSLKIGRIIKKYIDKFEFSSIPLNWVNKVWVLPAVIYSVFFTIVIVAIRFSYLLALGASFPIMHLLFFTTIIQLAGVLPVSLNSIGISEGLIVFLYSLVGISPEIAFAVAILERFIMIVASSVGATTFHKKYRHDLHVS